MARNVRPLTPEGKRIKKYIIDLGITQAEFCRKHDIPRNKLTDIMHTDSVRCPQYKLRLKVYRIIRGYDEAKAGNS